MELRWILAHLFNQGRLWSLQSTHFTSADLVPILTLSVYGTGGSGSGYEMFALARLEERQVQSILIVEDDSVIRLSLEELFQLHGYAVFTASNGLEGMNLLKSIPTPSVVLLDLMMPVMTGWEFMIEKNKNESLAAIPVVIMSAGAKDSSIGEVHFLRKPFRMKAVMDTVTRCSA